MIYFIGAGPGTMENEKVYKDLNDLAEQSGYFSLIVIPSEERQKEN